MQALNVFKHADNIVLQLFLLRVIIYIFIPDIFTKHLLDAWDTSVTLKQKVPA